MQSCGRAKNIFTNSATNAGEERIKSDTMGRSASPRSWSSTANLRRAGADEGESTPVRQRSAAPKTTLPIRGPHGVQVRQLVHQRRVDIVAVSSQKAMQVSQKNRNLWNGESPEAAGVLLRPPLAVLAGRGPKVLSVPKYPVEVLMQVPNHGVRIQPRWHLGDGDPSDLVEPGRAHGLVDCMDARHAQDA